MNVEEIFNKFQAVLLSNQIDSELIILSKNKTDYSILLKNTIIFKFKPGSTDYICIKKMFQSDVLSRYPYTICKITSSFILIPVSAINNFDENFSDLLLIILQKILGTYSNDEFGCCHRYIDCSDAKRCVHPNKLKSLGCMYKRNLEKGLIFYGHNKNI